MRAVVLLPLIMMLSATPVAAGFTVCNETAHPVRVALGHHNGEGWRSEGWWRVPPERCMTLINRPLIARYYYLHARHEGVGGGWDDDRYFCLGTGERWEVVGRDACAVRGNDSAGFFEVDTGENADWTHYLND